MRKNEQRISPRTPINVTIRITLVDGTTIETETWDLSDSGIGIKKPASSNINWELGMKVKGQVQGLPISGPELPMEIIQISEQRIGLKLLKI